MSPDGMSSDHPLRRRRAELGLTQAELAYAARVSRQLVAAVEAGVNVPAVDAGLRLARALNCSVEDLFEQRPHRLGRWRAVSSGLVEKYGRALLVAGCDPVLALAEAMLAESADAAGAAFMVAFSATSGEALRSLQDGGIHAAVVHGREGGLPRAQADVIRLQLAHWQVGVGVARSLAARSLGQCLEQDVPIVQRQESAASQQALRRAASVLGHPLPVGAVASGHSEAARAAAMLGCAAITTEGAALERGLGFAPLETHTVELWLDRRWQAHQGFDALGNLLTSTSFTANAARLGGYDMSGCGTVLAAQG